ncbi:MAG: VOC family protein [Bacillota bacterium]|jgi:PhnB protein
MFSHYLLFNCNCAEALETYVRAFGAEILEMQRYRDMPPGTDFPVAEHDRDLVLHARLQWGGTEIMCADSPERSQAGSNMYVSVTTQDVALVQRAWDILKQEGTIYMELAPAFFAAAHGSLQDRFGINWMFTALK